MDHPVTGSAKEIKKLGPFDESRVWAMHFIQGIVTLGTMNDMAERIQTINSMLDLPLMRSGSSYQVLQKRIQYTREMNEIEEAIRLLCLLTDVPEA